MFHLVKNNRSIAYKQAKQFMSFWSDDGWNKLESWPKDSQNENSKPLDYYDYKYFLREFQQDVTKPLVGKTIGEIPKWVEGSLIQNGPGKFTFGESTAKHWFDGASVIQKFKVKDGKASYECQLLDSETFRRNTKANKHVVAEFSTPAQPDPCHTIFQRFQAIFAPFVTDNCAVSIYPIDGSLYALTETPKIHRLDANQVNSDGMVNLHKQFEIMSHSAHPHVYRNGNVYNVGITKGEKGVAYAVYEIPSNQGKGFEESKVVAKIPSSWPWHPGYMHSFGITDSYFIIIEQPLTISIRSIVTRPFFSGGFSDCFRWKNQSVNLHAIHRETGDVKTFTSDPFFFFHTINQYEDDGHIVLDVCTYDNADVINAFMIDTMKGKHWHEIFDRVVSGKPLRLVLPMNNQGSGNSVKLDGSKATAHRGSDGIVHVKPEPLCDEFCELPRFNQDYLAKKYKYFYCINFNSKISATGKVMKIDVESKKLVHEWYENGTSPSEPIFIPSPNPKSEDDGVLILSLLSCDKEEDVSLVLLDAKDLREISRTKFTSSGPVPKTLHGWFT